MTTSKIRIKLGAIEVEYEGSENFLKEELPQLLSAVSDLYSKSHAQLPGQASAENDGALTGSVGAKQIQATTGAIAAKLQAKTGPDLILAAVARLTFSVGQEICPRQKIIDEMKTASSYYKKNYVNNLSKSLGSLVKDGKLNEPSQDSYALTASTRAELESRLV